MKKAIVLSLGGSLIVPDRMDVRFLDKFVKTLRRHYKNWKFVVVCGGGVIARKYISALRAEGKSVRELNSAGIMATRMNARFVMQLFGKDANSELPLDMKEVKNDLAKNNVVVCGALRYAPNSTSDGTAAKLAHYLKTDFINLTNVKGLYTDNPNVNKKAKFIPKITWENFEKRALRLKHKPGQHFVLDGTAAVLIRKHKIRTFIIGKKLKNLSKILKGKKFVGTEVGR
jgi:uridylate kinase